MATMKAIGVKDGKGPAEALFMDTISRPVPQGNQALVKIKAFGLNRMDLLQREGKYPLPPQAPSTMGVEFSGVIEELADSQSAFKVGDEVFGLAYGGAYAEYIAVSTRMLVHKPSGMSWVEAAGIPETWITATQALNFIGEFKSGQSVLWHAGASSVSISGIQLSKALGASKIFVTAGSQEKIDFCIKELGATAGFNYNTQDWAKGVLEATGGKGVDLIVDFIGANYFASNLAAAARDGRIVELALMSGFELPVALCAAATRGTRKSFEISWLKMLYRNSKMVHSRSSSPRYCHSIKLWRHTSCWRAIKQRAKSSVQSRDWSERGLLLNTMVIL